MQKLVLGFVGGAVPELYETSFYHPLIGEEKRCIRGKKQGAYSGYGTFQWTKAVQALAILLLRGFAARHLGAGWPPGRDTMLIGMDGSLALSLDYAIEKQSLWLLDFFGCDARGHALAPRIIARSNPRKRRNGPVALALNAKFLDFAGLQVQLNFHEIMAGDTALEMAELIESQWENGLQGELLRAAS